MSWTVCIVVVVKDRLHVETRGSNTERNLTGRHFFHCPSFADSAHMKLHSSTQRTNE